MPRPPGIDDATLRAFEIAETHAHAIGDREVRDLADCLLLHAPTEPDPYVNRLGAIRWPDDPTAFDRRLGEAISVFAGIDRRPHVWTPPAFRQPADLEDRLRANGFREIGAGAHLMVMTRAVAPRPLSPGLTVERVPAGDPRGGEGPWVREVALLLARAFAFADADLAAIERDVVATTGMAGMTTVVVRDGDEALAAGRAFMHGDVAYLLSIGTDPLAAGRGLGTLVTTTLAEDAIRAGARGVSLAVRTQNDRALGVYERSGFEIVGDVAGELMLG